MADRPPPSFRLRSIVLLGCAGTFAGCVSTPEAQSFNRVQSITAVRLGKRVEWNGHTADDRAVAACVNAILSQPLSVDAAVQVVLLNNHKLQATFEELGIAQADFVQAGLLQNPVFNLSVRFPTEPPSKTYLDIAAVENFLNVFLI